MGVIDILPNELLQEILIQANLLITHFETADILFHHVNYFTGAVRTFRQVSRRWKFVVDLPSSYELRMSSYVLLEPFDGFTLQDLNDFTSWLAGCKSLIILSIRSELQEDLVPITLQQSSTQYFLEAILSIVRHKNRIFYLDFCVDRTSIIRCLLEILSDSRSTLRLLHLTSIDEEAMDAQGIDFIPKRHLDLNPDAMGNHWQHGRVKPFVELPYLCSLKIGIEGPFFQTIKPESMSGSLTYLELLSKSLIYDREERTIMWTYLHDFLCQLNVLTDLRLSTSRATRMDMPPEGSRLTLPSLRSLYISMRTRDVAAFLCKLDAVLLKFLSVSVTNPTHELNFDEVFGKVTFPSLREIVCSNGFNTAMLVLNLVDVTGVTITDPRGNPSAVDSIYWSCDFRMTRLQPKEVDIKSTYTVRVIHIDLQ